MKRTYHSLSRTIAAATLCLAAYFPASAQDMQAKLPNDPNVTKGILDNGLTYYIRNNHKPANKVELRLVVKAGSILETDEQQGLAHFMEHMNFNGTKNFQKNDLVSYLQSIGVQFGADLNAYTAFDQTVYILPIPTDKPGNLEKGFQIIEDWAHNALLTDKDIDDERGVVLEESRLGKGADDRMLKKYFPKLAQGSLYADRLPIGKDDILKTFKYNTIRSYYKDWYRPDLQGVIVVGDIDVATAKKMITDHFAKLKNPAKEQERRYVSVTARTAPEAMVVTDKEATNSTLILTFPYTRKEDEITQGDYRRNMVRALAMQILNRRLEDLSQGSNPPFLFAGVGLDDMIHGYQSFNCYTVFGNDGPQKALNALTGELIRARDYGFSNSELELERKNLMAGMDKSYNERNTTDSKEYVEEYIRNFLDNEPFPGIEQEYGYYKNMLPQISVDEVNAVIKQWLGNPNTFTLITAPDKADVKLPTDKELLDMTTAGMAQHIAKTEEKVISTELMTTKPTAGKVAEQHKEEGLDATTYTLSNGIKVTIRHTDFKSDEILLSGLRKGGASPYGLADRSNVHFASDIVDAMGLATFSPTDLEKVLAGRKLSVNMTIGDINDDIQASSTVKDFETMMQVLYLSMMSPRKDTALFNAFIEKQKTMVQFMKANPQAAFVDTLVKKMYNSNPLARMVIPTAADFDRINLDRALEIYRNEFSTADGYHFFITGNVDAATALPLIETYLGSIPGQHRMSAIKDNGVRPIKGTAEMKYNNGKEKKSMIVVAYTGEVKYSEDLSLKAQALAEILNIKVVENLREKLGAIYGGGFNASVAREPYSRYSIQLYLPCGPENVEKLLAAANDEIKAIATKGPDAKDLDKVKSQWREKYLTDVKENKYWQGTMQSVLFWGKDKSRALHYQETISKLTPADIKATAAQLFGSNKLTAVLYPES